MKKMLKSKLNGGNLGKALNTCAASVVHYTADIGTCVKSHGRVQCSVCNSLSAWSYFQASFILHVLLGTCFSVKAMQKTAIWRTDHILEKVVRPNSFPTETLLLAL